MSNRVYVIGYNQRPWYVQPCLCDWVIKGLVMSSNDTKNHCHHHDHCLDMILDVAEALSSDTTNHRHHHDHRLDMILDVAGAIN